MTSNQNLPFIVKSVGVCTSVAALGYIGYKVMQQMSLNAEAEEEENKKKRVYQIMSILKLDPTKVELTSHELHIACMISKPGEEVNLEEVGGCAQILKRLQLNVVAPLRLMAAKVAVPSSLYKPPKGVLLHGPPGCGKTLIARAIAKEVNAFFINFDSTVLIDKDGTTTKLAKALFSLSEKIQPCVIFIDEIGIWYRIIPVSILIDADSVLRNKQEHETTATAVTKAQFIALWDAFLNSDSAVVIIGATNRPQDVDEAVLRRMPLRLHVPKPDSVAREQILRVLLRKENLVEEFNYRKVAFEMDSMSGLDMKEVVRLACLSRCQSVIQNLISTPPGFQPTNEEAPSIEEIKLSHDDIIRALNDYKYFDMETFAGSTVTEEIIQVE